MPSGRFLLRVVRILRARHVVPGAAAAGMILLLAHCSDSQAVSASGGGTGGSFYEDASGDAAVGDGSTGSCTSVDYSFARTCDVDAGTRSNARSCTTSFDCAGVCCACPAHVADAGGDASGDASADAGSASGDGDGGRAAVGPGFTVYECACGACVTDTAVCARMLAGDPTLCP